jgi:UDP-glucose 4-epimerase
MAFIPTLEQQALIDSAHRIAAQAAIDKWNSEVGTTEPKIMTDKKTIVVTGGCGYIGSHIVRAFNETYPDCKMVVVDRVRRGHTLVGVDWFIMDDFATDGTLKNIVDMQPDIIVHCAGTSLVGPSIQNPAEYYDNNVSKTIKLLNALKDMEKSPVVMFSSSASVYGDANVPAFESDLVNPISPYGKTKAMTEQILADYQVAYGIPSVCFRYFNAAGAMPGTHNLGQEPGATHIIARVLEAQINGSEFKLNGNEYDTPDGSCIRDYIHVWDIAQAHIKAFHLSLLDATPQARVMNLGTNKGISNQEIVNYVTKHYGKFNVTIGDARQGDPAVLVANSDEAQTLLDWTPYWSSIESIIGSAYKWYTR